jgi:GT2 family glycosyltransferase
MSSQLALSVVVPVRNGEISLAQTLRTIRNSDLAGQEFELIVVDDSSTDRSAAIAARYADKVVRLTGDRSGLAYARNRGAELAHGEAIAFIDSDVMILPDTLARMHKYLDGQQGLAAISTALDSEPGASNFISQYWSLLLHFGDKTHPGICGHFSSRCGMVRRSALMSIGMFDEWKFGTGTLEGVELGLRFERGGYDVLLDPAIQVTGLKRWTLSTVFREVWNRSALLARSLGYQRTRMRTPGDVVFTLSRAAIPALALLGTAGLSAAFLPTPAGWPVRVAIVVAAVVLTNFSVLRFFLRERGFAFAVGVVPVHFLFQSVGAAGLCAGWIMRDAVGDRMPDATTQAYAEVGLEVWPPVPRRQ